MSLEALKNWVAERVNTEILVFEPIASDAGFRRYFRIHLKIDDIHLADRKSEPASLIAVHAPPETEKNQAFIEIGAFLARSELRVPKVIAQDLESGFMLLEDFGSVMLADRLNEETVSQYFQDCMGLLLHMSVLSRPRGLPDYSEALLRQELELFPDWFLNRLVKEHVPTYDLKPWGEVWPKLTALLVESAIAQPQVFVHRDFHSKNILCIKDNGLGMIDYQDAVWGPFTYDLVSLLKDRYIHWPRDKVNEWALDYHYRWGKLQEQLAQAEFELSDEVQIHKAMQVSEEAFMIAFELMGLQRHLKMLGIFCRLWLRDQKPIYLALLPRVLDYVIEVCESYDGLTFALPLFESLQGAMNQDALRSLFVPYSH